MAASMWEVTRLILGAPGDAAGIADAHGFTAQQVADLLPMFLDNTTTAYSGPGDLPPAQPDGAGADALARWLDAWAGRLADGSVDVVSHDAFGVPDFALDPFDALDPDLLDAGASYLPEQAVAASDPVVAFGQGGESPGPHPGDDEPDGPADGDPAPGPHQEPDLDLGDPFDLRSDGGQDPVEFIGDPGGADPHDGVSHDGDPGAGSAFH
jgi:hypothetical protein